MQTHSDAGRARSGGLALLLLLSAANLLAWSWAWAAFGARPALLGTALLAWVLGLRHAVDADHIAAIDNVVRKLMQQARPAVATGFFFSLGHSTVVLLASVGVAMAAGGLQPRLEAARDIGGTAGTLVSAGFLLAIAAVNVAVLRGVWRSFRQARHGVSPGAEQLHSPLSGGGLLARLLRPLFCAIGRSWHMYPLGFLFGLGFDTATEIGLLGISATQAAQGLPPWRILVFPALFAVGMALADSADSVLMVRAYGWAFVNPLRKLWYNLTMTAASVAVALLVGGVEAGALLAGRLGLRGPPWRQIAALNDDLADFGFTVIGLFALCWAISALVWRWRGLGRAPARP